MQDPPNEKATFAFIFFVSFIFSMEEMRYKVILFEESTGHLHFYYLTRTISSIGVMYSE